MKSTVPTRVFQGFARQAAVLAAVLFALAAIGFGLRVEGYSHAQHPLALLGAWHWPQAWAFNLLAFVLPGLLVASVALRLRARLGVGGDSGWGARIGAQLLLIAALAFAAQGLLPLEADDLEGMRSSRHAAAWMVWLIAFAVGAAALGVGLRRAGGWHGLATASIVAAVALPVVALVLPALVPAGMAQRLAMAVWFAWAIFAGRCVARAAPQP